jgi:PAS domain S-box-containing protein
MQEINLYNLTDDFAFELDSNANVKKIIWGNNKPLGYPTKLIINKPIWSFLLPNATEKLEYLITHLKQNELRNCELLLADKNKKTNWYSISITCKLFNKAKIYIVYCKNINELKKQVLISEENLFKLSQVNKLNSEIIHSTQAIILVLNNDKKIESISKGAEKILGYNRKELINKSWFDKILPSKKFPEFEKGYDAFIVSRRQNRVITAPIFCKDNTSKLISWRTSKIISDGKVIRTVAIGKEVTEITNKVNLLQESETRFRTLAQLVQVPLSFISTDGKIIFVNKAYTKEYGFKLKEIPDVETLLSICYKDKAQRNLAIDEWHKELKIIGKDRKIISKRAELFTKDGERKIVEYSAVLSNDYIYYSYLDITSHIEKETLLLQSRETFKRIAESTPVAIAGCDTTTFKVVFSNKQFKEVLGYSQEDINNMDDWGDLIVYDNEKEKAESLNVWQDIKYELLTNSSSVIKSLERKILCKNGSIKHFEVAITFDNSTIYALFYDITERKIAEDKLKKSEAQFRNLAEQMLLPVCFIDFDGKFLFLNKSFTQKFGYTLKDFPDIRTVVNNTKASKEVKKQGIFGWQNEVKGLFENKKNIIKSIEIETKNGEIRQVDYSASLADDNFVFYVYSDVTEQKKAELELKLSEERFRNIAENLPMPLVSLNPITGDLFSNKKHKDIIGYNNTNDNKKKTDLSKFSIDDLVDNKSKVHFSELVNKVKNNNEHTSIIEPSYTIEIICKDKKIRTFEISENIFGNTLYSVFHDITEQLKATQLLKDSQQKFKALAENMPMAIGGYDANGNVIFLNNHFTITTGYTENDVPNIKEWYKKTQPQVNRRQAFYEHWMKIVADFRTNKIKIKPEIKATSRCKDGSFKHFTYSFSIYKDITYFLIIDITEQEKAKKELEKSHKELRNLASHLQEIREEERKSISREIHDELGQQITGMKMDVSSIFKKRKAMDADEELKRKEIIEAFNASIKIVRKIATQLRPSILDDLGVIATFEWLIQDFKKRTGIECVFYYNIDENQINIDFKNNLFRILQESLTNITRHSAATSVNIDFFIAGDQIRLIIADNGKGFNQNSPKETLGIIGMRERTSILNGSFVVVSEKMKGTRIIISIPLNK